MEPIALFAAGTAAMFAWLGLVIRLARAHIDNRINKTLPPEIEKAVVAAVEPLRVQIDNGLTDKTNRIDEKVDRLIEHLIWKGNERREGQTP